MTRRCHLAIGAALVMLALSRPASAGDGMAWGGGTHLALTLAETGLAIGAAGGLQAHARALPEPDAGRTRRSAGLQVGAALAHGVRAGLALELTITAATQGVEPSSWRAVAAISSGGLHLAASGLVLASLFDPSLDARVFGDRRCYPSGHCQGERATALGTTLLVQSVFVAVSVVYSGIELGIGIHAAKRSSPGRPAPIAVAVTPWSAAVAGRF